MTAVARLEAFELLCDSRRGDLRADDAVRFLGLVARGAGLDHSASLAAVCVAFLAKEEDVELQEKRVEILAGYFEDGEVEQ